MSNLIGPNEIRVVIRPVEARDYDLGPIPAELFKKTFDAFLTALLVTDRELQPKARSSEFLISQLALKQRTSRNLLKTCKRGSPFMPQTPS